MIDIWPSQVTSDRPVTLLTVCEGNICRSPLAAQLLREQLSKSIWEYVESAGIRAVSGAAMDEFAAKQSRLLGGAPDEHVARQLTAQIASDADLILTMTRTQRDQLVSLHPRALRKTFTLTEFSRLLNSKGCYGVTDPADVRLLVRRLSDIRSTVKLTHVDDVEDPYRQTAAVHARVACQINEVCRSIAASMK